MTSEPAEQQPETPPPVAGNSVPRVSGLAKASLVCGIISVVGLLQSELVLLLYDDVNDLVRGEAFFMLLAGPVGLLLGIAVLLNIWTSAEETASRRVAVWGVGVSCLPCLVIAALVAGSLFGSGLTDTPLVFCSPNVSKLCAAAINYATDHRGPLPPVDSWPEDFEKGHYIEDDALVCPAAPDAGRGYAMNARLRGLSIEDIRRRTSTVLFFECAPGSPPAGGPELLPPEPRHRDLNGCFVFGFADGHTEWVRPKELGKLNWDPKAE